MPQAGPKLDLSMFADGKQGESPLDLGMFKDEQPDIGARGFSLSRVGQGLTDVARGAADFLVEGTKAYFGNPVAAANLGASMYDQLAHDMAGAKNRAAVDKLDAIPVAAADTPVASQNAQAAP